MIWRRIMPNAAGLFTSRERSRRGMRCSLTEEQTAAYTVFTCSYGSLPACRILWAYTMYETMFQPKNKAAPAQYTAVSMFRISSQVTSVGCSAVASSGCSSASGISWTEGTTGLGTGFCGCTAMSCGICGGMYSGTGTVRSGCTSI